MNSQFVEQFLAEFSDVPDALKGKDTGNNDGNGSSTPYGSLTNQYKVELSKLKAKIAEMKSSEGITPPTSPDDDSLLFNTSSISSNNIIPDSVDTSSFPGLTPLIDADNEEAEAKGDFPQLYREQKEIFEDGGHDERLRISVQVKQKINELTDLLNQQLIAYMKPIESLKAKEEKLLHNTAEIMAQLENAEEETASWKRKYKSLGDRLRDLEEMYSEEVIKLQGLLNESKLHLADLEKSNIQLSKEKEILARKAASSLTKEDMKQRLSLLQGELTRTKLAARRAQSKMQEAYELRIIELESQLYEYKLVKDHINPNDQVASVEPDPAAEPSNPQESMNLLFPETSLNHLNIYDI